MTTKKKVFTGIGLIFVLLLGLSFYGNYKLDNIIDTVVQSGLVEFDSTSPSTTKNGIVNNNSTANGSAAVLPDGSISAPGGNATSTNPDVTPSVSGSQSLSPQQFTIANGVERQLGRKVDRRDLLTAGTIMINRFSWGEINYLYSTGSRKHNKEDLKQVRSLLLSRLSAGDVATLTALGHKYGLSLKILDASVPIK